jgi:large conductance mechanosensitive channel
LGGVNISDKTFTIGHASLKWGMFLQSVIDFTIIAFSIFLVVKALNSLTKKHEDKPAELSTQEKLLTEIRDLLKNSK